jgi:hypothetical protein
MRTSHLTAVAALAATVACTEGTGIPEGMSRARILLTDAPFPYDQVQRVDVHVVSVAAATSADTSGGAEWVTIAEPRQVFDLLVLQGGATVILGEGEIPAEQYAAVRLVIDTDLSGITLSDGSAAVVDWQGGGEKTLHALVEQPLALWAPGTDLDVIIDFDVGRSFLVTGTGAGGVPQFLFIPWIRAVNEAATGVLAGTVRGADGPSEVLVPVPSASITVFRQVPNSYGPLGGYAAATGRTDAEGRYAIRYLSPGEYRVEVRPPARFDAGVSLSEPITVEMGETATLDVTLPPTGSSGESVYLGGPSVVVLGDTAHYYTVAFSGGDSIVSPPIVWTSSNPATGTLIAGGSSARLVAEALGSTQIVAAFNGAADSIGVTIVEEDTTTTPSGPVALVELTPAAQTVSVGDSAAFWATLRNAQGDALYGREVTWTATDTTVARFEFALGQTAMLRALSPGTVTVTATSEGESGSGTLTVQ